MKTYEVCFSVSHSASLIFIISPSLSPVTYNLRSTASGLTLLNCFLLPQGRCVAELDYYVATKKFWLSLLSLSDNWVILFFAGRPNFLTLARLTRLKIFVIGGDRKCTPSDLVFVCYQAWHLLCLDSQSTLTRMPVRINSIVFMHARLRCSPHVRRYV